MDRFRFDDNRVKPDAIAAFLAGVVATYVLGRLGFRGGGIFTTLVVTAVGGLWYHWRRIL
jgi:hypothetical protein